MLDTLKNIGLTIVVLVGVYLAVFLSYILIPAAVFLFIFYIVRNLDEIES